MATTESPDQTAMDIDQGGSVDARKTCPHVLASLRMPESLDKFPDLSASTQCEIEVQIQRCEHTESWVCCLCHKVLCGRYGAKHMIEHKETNPTHCIALGCGDLSFWCYPCQSYLDHLSIRRIFEFYKIAHVKKFQHEINNIEKLMEQTDFSEQDKLEAAALSKTLEWFPGTELLNRKYGKKDEIEYDSDPEHKDQQKQRSHIHKGIIIKLTENAGSFGKLMVKDETGSYGNYGLETIKIKLPPATPQNTVRRKDRKTKPNTNDMFAPSMHAVHAMTTSSDASTTNYDFNAYRGYDEKDDYKAPMEYLSYERVAFRKKEWKKGDEIEYKQVGGDEVRAGKLMSMDLTNKVMLVELQTGEQVEVSLDAVLIGCASLFWRCRQCAYENAVKSKQCTVCTMNAVTMSEKSRRPVMKAKDESKLNDEAEAAAPVLPARFFVYGTLRDDDDSGAMWTATWTQGCKACNGKIYGYKLYQQHGLRYPFAVRTGKDSDFIVGRVITWDDAKIVEAKRKHADSIEGYQDGNPHSLFRRASVNVEITDGGDHAGKATSTLTALVYYQQCHEQKLTTQCTAIPNGDWLQRNKL